jgi:hypothetical protein
MRTQLVLPLFFASAVLACSSSSATPPVTPVDSGTDSAPPPDTNGVDTTSPDSPIDTTTTDTTTTDAPVTDAAGCPFAGTYSLVKYECGTTDVTSSWKTIVTTTTVVFSAGAGGGCHLEYTNINSACTESETAELTLVSGDSWTSVKKGVTSCSPAKCVFTTGDAPCVVGDRAGTETVTITKSGTSVVYKSPSTTTDICGGAITAVTLAPK